MSNVKNLITKISVLDIIQLIKTLLYILLVTDELISISKKIVVLQYSVTVYNYNYTSVRLCRYAEKRIFTRVRRNRTSSTNSHLSVPICNEETTKAAVLQCQNKTSVIIFLY